MTCLLMVLGVVGCQDNETAIARGDRLWADSNYTGALAEYRLAVAQRGDDHARIRLAHAYARAGEINGAREVYGELVAEDPSVADQAARDFLVLARRALARGDEFGMANAVDAALTLRPELPLPDLAAPLARYYQDRGDMDRAMAYYRRALAAVPPDSAPPLLYQMGLIEENRERCEQAVDYYRAFREQAGRAGSTEGRGPLRSLVLESRWHLGNCMFRLAEQARTAGRVTEALARLDRMIALGEPENLLDQAWFDRGETLFGLGRYDEALESYRRVIERNPSRTGQLVERARRQMDAIRFGVLPDTTTTIPPNGRE